MSIGKAAKILGVSEMTLRRWDEDGRLVSIRTEGGHRRYDISKIKPESVHRHSFTEKRKTIAYARASVGRKDDLERQKQELELFCSQNGWNFEIISDIGSGVDYYKKGLAKLLDALIDDQAGRLVLTGRDRLLRFGAELVFAICETRGVEVVIINNGEEAAFEDDLTADVMEIVAVLSARLYGSRGKKSKKLLDNLAKAVEDN